MDILTNTSCKTFQYPVIFLGETKIDNVNRERLYEALGFLESFLDGKKFVAGDELSLADISILVSVTSIDVSFVMKDNAVKINSLVSNLFFVFFFSANWW